MEHIWQVTLSGFEINIGTLMMVWVGMLTVLILAWAATRNLQVIPSKFQVVGESFFDVCRGITMSTAGKRGDEFLFFVGSVFLFILTANLMGQLPLKLIPLPEGKELMAATGDINTTAALAVMTLVMYVGFGIQKKGWRYFLHYLQPSPLFLPLNLLEDFTRPGSLLIRLFFNILVGEILSGIAMSVTPYVLPSLVIFLELFVAVVQAYIFAILSSVYISLMSEDHTAEHH